MYECCNALSFGKAWKTKISILECRGFPFNRRNMSCSCKLWERKKWENQIRVIFYRVFLTGCLIIVLLASNMKCFFCKVGSSARWEHVLCKQWGGGNCHLFSGFPILCKRWGIQLFRFEYGKPAHVNCTLFAQCQTVQFQSTTTFLLWTSWQFLIPQISACVGDSGSPLTYQVAQILTSHSDENSLRHRVDSIFHFDKANLDSYTIFSPGYSKSFWTSRSGQLGAGPVQGHLHSLWQRPL